MLDFNDLDLGYEQVVQIHSYICGEGESLATRINGNIDKLTNDWVAEDATIHINNLIDVYNKLVKFIKGSVAVLAEATEKIVEVQETRESNGAKSSMVGGKVSKEVDLAGDKAEITTSVKYTTDVAVLRADYDELNNLTEEFKAFADKVEKDGDELMQKWLAGNKRSETFEELESFKTISKESHAKMTEACEKLELAVSNIENISEG